MKGYVEELSFDDLPKLMEFFRQLLLTKASKPVVIYGHCEVCAHACVCVCVCGVCVCANAYSYLCKQAPSRVV